MQTREYTTDEIIECLISFDTETLDTYYAIEQERIEVQVLE